tara:strand:+ start:1096 stop:1722 length:627 start_codon:yes stop_codon:yes gene_type:complete
MHHYKLYISVLFLFTSLNVSSQYLINLNFESGFEFESQKKLVSELKNSKSKKQIEKILMRQDWIKDFSLVYKPFKKEVYLSIVNREPIFVLNNQFFYDVNLHKFKFDNSKKDLVIVQGPIKNEEDILLLINRIESVANINFEINKINYSYVNGWDVITDKLLIRFGNNLNEKKFNDFEYTLNYLFENGKNPSIIDMRYKDGVALNYGK